MFTGLIEAIGRIEQVTSADSGRRVRIAAPFAADLKAGESVAVNGVCLTVAVADAATFDAVISPETLRVTNLLTISEGRLVNLERPLAADVTFEHVARGLALAEAGNFDALNEPAIGSVQGALHLVGVDLDFEEHLALRQALRGYFHESIIASGFGLALRTW